MTLALPSAAPRSPRRQVFVATALASSGAAMILVGMCSIWMKFRAAAPLRESSDGFYMIKDWLPADIAIPEVAANTMWVTFMAACLFAQWAVYSAHRNDSRHRSMALGLTALMGVAIINAQVGVWSKMGIGVGDGAYQSMFYAITGTVIVLVAVGIAFTAATLFRSIGGRADDTQVVSAHALYWYVLTAAFTLVWFLVYVQK
ncbi:MAG: cytochrome c oxidase subunit 3 [Acidimicrobiales bacterium]